MPPDAPLSPPSHGIRRSTALLVLVLFAGAAAFVFHRQWLYGERFAGNFDRLNGGSLPVRIFEARSLQLTGGVSAWSDNAFMGLNLRAHGGIHAAWSPIASLYAHAPENWFMPLTALIVALCLMVALSGAFAALRQLGFRPLPACAGTVSYGCSTLLALRLAQGEGFAYNLILLPWLFFFVAGVEKRSHAVTLTALAALLFWLFEYSFLQETAYVGLSLTAFVFIECRSRRNWRPLILLVLATFCAAIAAAPRILEVQRELALLMRAPSGSVHDIASFEVSYAQQNMTPREGLRFFDDGIFGRFPSEAAALGNNINLNEGFQVYASTFASLLALVGLMLVVFRKSDSTTDRIGRWRLIYAAVLPAAISALVLTKAGHLLLYHLFLGLDFSHGRLVTAALFPIAMLVAFGVQKLQPESFARSPRVMLISGLLAVSGAVAALWSLDLARAGTYHPQRIEITSSVLPQLQAMLASSPRPLEAPQGAVAGRTQPRVIALKWNLIPDTETEVEMRRDDGPYQVMGRTAASRYVIGDIDPVAKYDFRLRSWRNNQVSDYTGAFAAALFRPELDTTFLSRDPTWILSSEVAYVGLAAGIFIGWLAGLSALRRYSLARERLIQFMAALIILEAVTNLTFQLNGPHTRSFPRPFYKDNLFTAPPGTLTPPSAAERAALHRRLERDRYRTVLLEPADQFYSANLHVPMAWDLRTPQGGWSGVPKRLAVLPWPPGVVSMRRLIFRPETELPWDLLATLNVKYVVTANTALYFNLWDSKPAKDKLAGLEILENPRAVVPREFFVARTVPMQDFSQRREFPVPMPMDAQKESFVEGLPAPHDWLATGKIEAKYEGDSIRLTIDRAPATRFLVLNELYHPDWKASTADGLTLKVYPVNTVMRGIEIPPNVSEVVFRFAPPFAGVWPTAALLIGMAGLASACFWTSRSARYPGVRPQLTQGILRSFPIGRVATWVTVGLIFMGVNLLLLYLLVDCWRIRLALATLLAPLIGISLRFLVNDRFVFKQPAPTLARLRNYYAANTLGFLVWYCVTNLLSRFGVNYLVSAIAGTACSVGFNLATNFLWVWRKPGELPASGPAAPLPASPGFRRAWLVVLAAYIVIYGLFLLKTDSYPYVLDNNESYSSWWHARSLYENGVAHTKGLTDEVFSPSPAASPYIHSHQGNFPRLFTFVLYVLGLRTIGPQIWVTTFTVGLAALWFGFQFFSRLFNPRYAALACLMLMTDYLFFTQWQVGLYNIWHGFFFFSSLVCVQSLGTTDRRGRWFALTLLNFAALFYWEYVFTAFVTVLCGLYAVTLYWRRFRLVLLAATAMGTGAALAAGVLLAQLTAYMGWSNVMEDVRLTLTARNAAADPVLLERVTSFYREHHIIFWHNFMDATSLRTFTALWNSLLEFHLKYYSPALLYAAAVLAAGWGLGGWRALHRGWRRLIPLLLFAGLAAAAGHWSNGAFDESLRNEYLLTPGGPAILALEKPLLVLLTGLALACAVLGNAAMLGPLAGSGAGLPPFLLCGLLAYGAVYRIFTGYIYSGYLHRFVPLPVFLTAPLLGLMLYTGAQAAWHGLSRDSGARLLRVGAAVLGAATLAGGLAYWTLLQATYARVAPADSYAFLARLEKPPLKGRSVVSNVYPAPMAARTGSWGYADTSLFSGTLRLTPRGFEVERDLKYLWFADRDTNPAYLKPALAITVIPTPNFAEALERRLERRSAGPEVPPRAENHGLFKRAHESFQAFLQHRVVYTDGWRHSIVLLDWDYPPYLQPQDSQIRELAGLLDFQQKLALSADAQELARRWRVELDFLDADPAARAGITLAGDGRPVVFPAPVAPGPLTAVVNADQLSLHVARSPHGGHVSIKVNDATEIIDLAALPAAGFAFHWSSARPYGKYTNLPPFTAGFYLQTRLLNPAGGPRAELDYRYVHQEGTPEAATTFRLYQEDRAGDWRLVDTVTFLGAPGVPVRLAEFRRLNPDTVAEHARSAAQGDVRTYEQWLADHLTAHPDEWNRPGVVREALPDLSAGGPTTGGQVVRHLPLPAKASGLLQFSVTPGTRTKTGPEYFGLPFSLAALQPGAAATVAFTVPAARHDGIALPFGRLRLKLRLPTGRWGQAEPILTTGSNEAGDIVYVVYDDPHHIRLGVDHWFIGGPVTKPIPIDLTQEHELEISLGSLFPPAEDIVFVGRPPAEITRMKERQLVKLDGRTVIDSEGSAYSSSPSQVAIGRNLIHATSCGPVFTGEILSIERVWPDIK